LRSKTTQPKSKNLVNLKFKQPLIITQTINWFVLLTIVATVNLYSQTPQIDSLKQELKKAVNDTIRSDFNERIAYEYLYYQPDSAKRYIDKALELAQLNNYQRGIAKAYNRMGTYYIVTSKYPDAILEFQKALPLYKAKNDSLGLSESYGNLGVLEFYLRDYESSEKNFRQALDYVDSVNNRNQYIKYIVNLSGVFREKRVLDSAVYYSKKALNLIKGGGDPRIAGVTYFNLGTARYFLGSYDEAIANLNLALQSSNFPVQFQCLAKSYIAQSYTEQGRLDEAANELLAIEQQVLDLKDQYVILAYYEARQKLHEANNNTAEALAYAQKYIKLNDEIHNREQSNILQNLKIQFGIEEQQLENELLRSDAEMQALQIKHQRYAIIGISVLIVLLFLLLFILYRMYSYKKSANRILKKEQQVLNTSNKNLTAINHQKNNLFSIVAHDVKSPVAAVLSSINLLHNNYKNFTSEEIEALSEELKKQTSNLYYLIDSVLLWAKSQMNGYKFIISEVHPHKVVSEVVEAEDVFIERKNLKIDCVIPKEDIIFTDRQVVIVIMRNLLSNAIKFTPANGKMTFSANRTSEVYELSISDTGVGMSKTDLDKVLIKKERFSVKGTNDEAGNGIGLILCQEIAHQIGGEIVATSQLGNGSTFTLKLPIIK